MTNDEHTKTTFYRKLQALVNNTPAADVDVDLFGTLGRIWWYQLVLVSGVAIVCLSLFTAALLS
jgi:hypothetical protein